MVARNRIAQPGSLDAAPAAIARAGRQWSHHGQGRQTGEHRLRTAHLPKVQLLAFPLSTTSNLNPLLPSPRPVRLLRPIHITALPFASRA
jgi:hypothetical protein